MRPYQSAVMRYARRKGHIGLEDARIICRNHPGVARHVLDELVDLGLLVRAVGGGFVPTKEGEVEL